ncbi:MAG TPA: phosphotransferase [Thermodesulfovibrionales bacterium]|nr:phosphotransferase [Thermodesulfovibrionales bacterium]
MTEPITLFLPAAGLGERLRPITEHLPKPLLPVLGRPLIEIILEKVAPVCTGKIGMNLYYRSEMIREWASHSPYAERITFFPENPILGTGGALKNAKAFLSGGLFLVHNTDIILDLDFGPLVETHLSSGNIATLVTHEHPQFSNVVINEFNYVIDVENPGESRPNPDRMTRKVAFTGIALYSPQILEFLPKGISHATVAWLAAAAAGHKVQVLDVTGCPWTDVGTPATYASAILDALRLDGETIYCSPSARCGAIDVDGHTVFEAGCVIGDGSHLRNCIVLPGACVVGAHVNQIIGPDYNIDLAESEMQPSLYAKEQKIVSLSDSLFAGYFHQKGERSDIPYAGTAEAILIGFGGSDRHFFRIRNEQKSVVLMECSPHDHDFERQITYTQFFSSCGIPVPELLVVDAAHKRALFQDLGDTSLYSYLKLPRDRQHVTGIYSRVVEILVKLHGYATRRIHDCPTLQGRIFDYDHFRWETTYFLEEFVSGLRQITIPEPDALEQEFHTLASIADAFPKTIIHRDFQSQNIMITDGNMPRVIDYQGARIGPPTYDLASILWDPYHPLDHDMRNSLLAYYLSKRTEDDSTFSRDDFTTVLLPCRLQRHMQALGAYAFLSQKKGKRYFLKHVKEGVRLLKADIAEVKNAFPVLVKLIEKL